MRANMKKNDQNDQNTAMQYLKKLADDFTIERDWKKLSNPKDMVMQLSVEVAELMDHFLYIKDVASYDQVDKHRTEIEDETVDCLLSLLIFCNESKIDLTAAFLKKLKKLEKRYPGKGKS